MKLITVVLSLVLLLAGCTKHEAPAPIALLSAEEKKFVDEHVVNVGIEATYQPFISWADNEAVPAGLSYDVLRLVEAKTGLKLRLKNEGNLSEVIGAFKAKKIDLVTSLKQTPERMEFMSFTSPYISVGSVMLLKTMPAEFPVTVAYSKSYAIEDFLRPLAAQVVLVPFKNDTDSFDAFVSGKTFGVVLDLASAKQQEDRIGQRFNRAHVSFTYELAFAYQPENPVLGHVLEKGLEAISKDEMDAIRVKYFGKRAKEAKPLF